MASDRSWMYNRLQLGKKGLTREFMRGLDEFVQFATTQLNFTSEGKIRCPCTKCKNRKYSDVDSVKLHLCKKGFLPNYYQWHAHGEPYIFPSEQRNDGGVSSGMETNPMVSNPIRDMLFDAVGYDGICNESIRMDEEPNVGAQRFYDLLHAADEPLWPGCNNQSQLSTVARLLNIKSDYNLPEACYDTIAQLIKDVTPERDKMPKNFYETKKLVSGLGLPYEQIECCVNGCMLFRKEYEGWMECKFCNHPRWKPKKGSSRVEKNVPYARMHYLPLTPRLQRLYASKVTAEHMRWHAEHEPLPGTISHPSDAKAWKSFNQAHPMFSAEPRNVRLGLCTDGFTPFGQTGKQYSCWPVIVTPYNLPPGMCMKTPYMFLTAIIPGPKNPKKKLDVYLQPLVDELMQLWEVGVPTYDISKKENFQLKAALMWTISDFPAYGMLSGWGTAGRLSCPYCMENTKAFRLQNSRKQCFFDCHRQFLPFDHPFRKNKNSFRKNKVEDSPPPRRLSGDEIWDRVKDLPTVIENGGNDIPEGYGEHHNWSKQSIFWRLPYWRTNLIRHNLDVMHIIKNFFDNIFNTIFDVKGKTKDNDNARRDLREICRRTDLELFDDDKKKPKACYCLEKNARKILCEWIKNLKFPDGYVSNMSRCVDIKECKLFGLKSHDCHVFMLRLIPIAFRHLLPDVVYNALTELSLFFKDLTSRMLRDEQILKLEENIVVIICKLEKIFPPSFFDSMEHLPIHLPYEALVGGPVQYRWMYPFERFLYNLKRKVKNKARVEASICNAYLVEEVSNFCSHYFEPEVKTKHRRVERNDDGGSGESCLTSISTFNYIGRPLGASKSRFLTDKEHNAAALYVLLNTAEVQPYVEVFKVTRHLNTTRTSESEIELALEREFVQWFKEYVHNPANNVLNEEIKHLAWGPKKNVRTYTQFFVNGYNFHTVAHSQGKATTNSGVCIKGSNNDDGHIVDYYGALKEVVELEYLGLPLKRAYLFHCDWYDPRLGVGVRIHHKYKIVDINHKRLWKKYEPFALAHQATQVYFITYPSQRRDTADWLHVCHVAVRRTIEMAIVDTALQEDESQSSNIDLIDDQLDNLFDPSGTFDEVETAVNADLQENEEDLSTSSNEEDLEESQCQTDSEYNSENN